MRVFADGTLQEWVSTAAGRAFWEGYFGGQDVEGEWEAARSGKLGDIGEILRRHLPRRGRIVEAGCGLGRVVVVLREWGYDCVGVDFSAACVARARAAAPGLPVEVGDVSELDFPDDALAGYVSLGVIEHDRSGPQRYLAEARRVLAPGGVLVVSVPFANPLRRAKIALGCWPAAPPNDKWHFHEYIYSGDRLAHFVVDAGFDLVREYDIDAGRGLSREFALMQRLEDRSLFLWWQLVRPFHYLGVLKSLVAHSHVVVAVKPQHRCPGGLFAAEGRHT